MKRERQIPPDELSGKREHKRNKFSGDEGVSWPLPPPGPHDLRSTPRRVSPRPPKPTPAPPAPITPSALTTPTGGISPPGAPPGLCSPAARTRKPSGSISPPAPTAPDRPDADSVATLERRLSAIRLALPPAWRPARPPRPPCRHGPRRRPPHPWPPARAEGGAASPTSCSPCSATLDCDLRGLRDRAILLLGFAGGLRRSEIVGLDCRPEETRTDPAGSSSRRRPAADAARQNRLARGRDRPRLSDLTPARSSCSRLGCNLGRISLGPLFRRDRQTHAGVAAERLTDKHVARLVQPRARGGRARRSPRR